MFLKLLAAYAHTIISLINCLLLLSAAYDCEFYNKGTTDPVKERVLSFVTVL